MKQRLTKHGILYMEKTSDERLQFLLQRVERGQLTYDKRPVRELRGFIDARGLKKSSSSTKKDILIAQLERADKDATFRFEDLPAELRVRVYELHLKSLDTNTGHFLAPAPITQVSKLVRQESMPIFYQQCTFHFDFNNIDPRSWIGLTEASARFSDGPILKGIKKLSISGIPDYTRCRCMSKIARSNPLRFTIEISSDGSMSELPQLDPIETLGGRKSDKDINGGLHLHDKDFVRIKLGQEAVRKFYRTLEARGKRAQKEKADRSSNQSSQADKEWSGFVEGPEIGLGLQRVDLEVLMVIFGAKGAGWRTKSTSG